LPTAFLWIRMAVRAVGFAQRINKMRVVEERMQFVSARLRDTMYWA